MSFIVPDEIEHYAEAHTTPPTELLAELAEETQATLELAADADRARSRAGCSSMLVYVAAASACSRSAPTAATPRSRWPRGCRTDGRIDTCEIDRRARRRGAALHRPQPVRATASRSTSARRSRRSRGSSGAFDFVFIDADKENYVELLRGGCCRGSRPTGLIAVDNTLWSGRVLDAGDDEETTRAIRELQRPDRCRRAGGRACSSRCATASP